jgi:hypothetical protein
MQPSHCLVIAITTASNSFSAADSSPAVMAAVDIVK